MDEYVEITIEGKTYKLPVIEGSEGERAFDITKLRQMTDYVTYDPGFANTGSCTSCITFMDGEKGILRYRGIPIEQLAEHSTFVETAYLLINGNLPTREELTNVKIALNDLSLVHEDMQIFYQNFPRRAHPMGILSGMVNALRSFYPHLYIENQEIKTTFLSLLSKVRTMARPQSYLSKTRSFILCKFFKHDV